MDPKARDLEAQRCFEESQAIAREITRLMAYTRTPSRRPLTIARMTAVLIAMRQAAGITRATMAIYLKRSERQLRDYEGGVCAFQTTRRALLQYAPYCVPRLSPDDLVLFTPVLEDAGYEFEEQNDDL